MFNTCAPKSIKAATSHRSMTTGTLLARLTNCTTRSGFRNRMGVIPFHSFLVTAFTWVGFGLGPERECCVLTVCCWRGFDCIPLGYPFLVKCFGQSGTLPCHVTLTLASETLQGVGVPGALSTTLCTILHPHISPYLKVSTFSGCSGGTANGSSLTQASPTIVGAGADRGVPVYSPLP